MVNDIVNGLSIKLNSVFGDEYEIYTEKVEQGMTEPCFFISALPVTHQNLLGTRCLRTFSFIISYFSDKESKNEDIASVSEKLMDNLEYITLLSGDLIRGTNMDAEVVDEVLEFSIQFALTMIEQKEKVYQEHLDSNVNVKEDE